MKNAFNPRLRRIAYARQQSINAVAQEFHPPVPTFRKGVQRQAELGRKCRPRAPTCRSHVETVHRLIENEFFDQGFLQPC